MEPLAFRSILVPVDGSASAEAALRLAVRLAAPDGEVVLAHVIHRAEIVAECVTPYGGNPTPALDALESDERDIFTASQAVARQAGIRSSTAPLDGPPADCIADFARQRGVDAIAMGTHGRRGIARIVLGSTAAGVLHHAAVPTFVCHEQNVDTAAAPFRHILVGLDASPAARSAAQAAVDLAKRDGSSVLFAYVDEGRDALAEQRARVQAQAYAAAAGVSSDTAVLQGDPVDALLVAAETCHAGLIAIGAHGGKHTLFGMGSIAEAIVRTSSVPVLVQPLPAVLATSPQVAHA
jgi:nucleotide-binding universal stress UspA family protein